MNILFPVSSAFCLIYILVIIRFYRSWRKTPDFSASDDASARPFVSVIIPVKNGERSIPELLTGLRNQDFPEDRREFIFVDDHSGDRSLTLLQEEGGTVPGLRILTTEEGKGGKKEALLTGVKDAHGKLIITTDADCVHKVSWLRLMAEFYVTSKARLISAPVRMSPATGLFRRFQALEFASLTGTGASSFLGGSPVMCNGANLAFEKDLFNEAFDHIHPSIPTGDDIFLMLFTKKKYPGSARFLKNPGAIADTLPAENIRSFFRQRVRWASKAGLYRDPGIIFLSFLVLLFNVSLILLLASGFIHWQALIVLLVLFFIKSVADYLFLKQICRFYRQDKLMKIFVPSQLIYPFYIVIVAVAGLIISMNYRKK